MATIRKRGKSWQAQIRLADHPTAIQEFFYQSSSRAMGKDHDPSVA